ncbi:hypothetical protein LIA77_09017 [Sarocladium implicatum]|nr:hypothetical protein LIA77_09017 [Sarocladium implicatum]
MVAVVVAMALVAVMTRMDTVGKTGQRPTSTPQEHIERESNLEYENNKTRWPGILATWMGKYARSHRGWHAHRWAAASPSCRAQAQEMRGSAGCTIRIGT